MQESLKDHGVLDDWFTYISQWNKSEQAETRQVWLVVYGVLVHGWTEGNFQAIAKVWGKLVHLEQGTNNTMSFESLKMLVVTKHFYRIEGDILLQIEDKRYRVFVSEIGAKSLRIEEANHGISHSTTSQQHKEAAMKEAVQESDPVEETAELQHNLEEATAVQRVIEIQNSNLEPNTVCLRDATAGSDHSSSHTKTLCCNQNVCSDDFINTTKGELQHTTAFNMQANINHDVEEARNKENDHCDKDLSDTSSSIGPPPGFEHNSHRAVPQNCTEEEDSKANSEDSIVKLAKESIQIGNLLGLKITHNEKGAEARITRSLRSNRKTLQQTPERSGNTQKVKRRL